MDLPFQKKDVRTNPNRPAPVFSWITRGREDVVMSEFLVKHWL